MGLAIIPEDLYNDHYWTGMYILEIDFVREKHSTCNVTQMVGSAFMGFHYMAPVDPQIIIDTQGEERGNWVKDSLQ